MPGVLSTLQGKDFGFLEGVAQAWGVELTAADVKGAISLLQIQLTSPQQIKEMLEILPKESKKALHSLAEAGGRLPWSLFSRQFGELRPMGAARRDREQPLSYPASITESLFYQALIGRAFLDSTEGPQEFAYLPDEFLPFFSKPATSHYEPLGKPAATNISKYIVLSNDTILDVSCTMLAALRLGKSHETSDVKWEIPPAILLALLKTAEVIGSDNLPIPKATRTFLEMPRPQALLSLVNAWKTSSIFNELLLTPGLDFEGNWKNDPLQTRHLLLDFLNLIPQNTWWDIDSFITALKKTIPDFQRPAGDYDSWFIRNQTDGTYLRGYVSWDAVEGQLVWNFITRILPTLGLVDLASHSNGGKPYAFRWSIYSQDLLAGKPPPGFPAEDGRLILTSSGQIRLKKFFPRSARYLLARISDWCSEKDGEFLYQLTADSLTRGASQGLHISHLLSLLNKYSSSPLPPTMLKAIRRWENFGVQVSLEKTTLLRVSDPQAIDALRKSRAVRWLGESLSPTVICIQPGKNQSVLTVLAELGWLGKEV